MAKKKKSAAKAGAKKKSEAAAPSEPTKPAGVVITEAEHAHHQRIKMIAAESRTKWDQYYDLKHSAKVVKESAMELDDMVRNLLAEGPIPTLFDKTSPPTDENSTPTAPASGSDAWRSVSIDELKQAGNGTLTKALKNLHKHSIETIGQLEDFRAKSRNGAWFEDVPDLGREGADEIESALDRWITKNRDAALFGKAPTEDQQRKAGAEELAAKLLPWREGVMRVINERGDYGPDVSVKTLRKFLKDTGGSDPDSGAVWTCDAKGIQVSSFGNQDLPATENRITYVEAVTILKKLIEAKAAAAAPVASGDASSVGDTAEERKAETLTEQEAKRVAVRKLIAKHAIEAALTANGLKKLVCPGGSGDENFSYVALEDGLSIHGAAVDGTVDLGYSEAAAILKEMLGAR